MNETIHISRAKISQIKKLKEKKHRDQSGLFIVQGDKVIEEVFKSSWQIEVLCATEQYLNENFDRIESVVKQVYYANEKELSEMGYFSNNNSAVAILRIRDFSIDDSKEGSELDVTEGMQIVLDGISDPGNLGTIIRSAAWFGIKKIVCSPGSVDIYNPKVIQATMGAFLRVEMIYVDLKNYFQKFRGKKKIFAADLGGTSLYKTELCRNSIVVFGSESHGISKDLYQYIDQEITIPSRVYSVESLNVGVAVGIVLAEVFRE